MSIRYIYCPICGCRLAIPGDFPGTHKVPDHRPIGNINLCMVSQVSVVLDFRKCAKCGCNMSGHPTGLCMKCYAEVEAAERPMRQKASRKKRGK